jgi:hypothetical protein
MNKPNIYEPAFPVSGLDSLPNGEPLYPVQGGITVLDYFAAHAPQPFECCDEPDYQYVAKRAYSYAMAMMEEKCRIENLK